jgi:ferrous iron transport protein A
MKKVDERLTLFDVKEGSESIIVSILGGKMASKRLADLGLKSGSPVKVISRSLFSGPIQIEVNGSRLAIGKGLALKIMVKSK